MARRDVRVDNRFFEDVDLAFGPERGPDGEPSADDFIRFDLFGIAEQVAARFDELPAEPSAPGVRTLVLTGLMFQQAAVYAAEASDGVVYLIGLEVEHY
ncbi:MAG: hypothetical protein GY925_27405 [Actinomycetia bacterium]|nr:hypothetical protein [Actinomycetes bacterium]